MQMRLCVCSCAAYVIVVEECIRLLLAGWAGGLLVAAHRVRVCSCCCWWWRGTGCRLLRLFVAALVKQMLDQVRRPGSRLQRWCGMGARRTNSRRLLRQVAAALVIK